MKLYLNLLLFIALLMPLEQAFADTIAGLGRIVPQSGVVSLNVPAGETLKRVDVKEGDKVVMWFASGSRDENVFPDPMMLDLTRPRNKYVSFGQGGPHVCLGMWLAKLEVKTLIQEVSERIESFEQTEKHEFLRSNFIGGIKRLPVAVKVK